MYVVPAKQGLLKKETSKAYGWLLKAFKKAFVRAPNIVVTDQDGAMRHAIAAEFPESKHRLYMFHIMQKIPAKIVSRIYDDTDFKDKFGKIVWNMFIGPEEFEDRWNKLMEEFNLVNHKWLSKMCRLRSLWVLAFFVDSPLCGFMRTTSRPCKFTLNKKKEVYENRDKVKVKNPSRCSQRTVRTKKRIKSGREISMKKSMRKTNKKKNGCGVCGSTDHNRRTCPQKNDVDALNPAVVVPGGSNHVDGGLRDGPCAVVVPGGSDHIDGGLREGASGSVSV
ncbi:FAR1-related sequence 5-like protein [Tanacetum coccineum]